MAILDENDRAKPIIHSLGEELAALSEAELGERIMLSGTEIERILAPLTAKKASREAARADLGDQQAAVAASKSENTFTQVNRLLSFTSFN